MSYHLNVRGLAGLHIGKHVTVKTKHTEASGVLQGFEHEGSVITELTYGGEEHHPGATTTHLTIFPNQRILAEMMDTVEVCETPDNSPRNAEHQAEMNGETGAPRGPRTVIVAHKLPSQDPSLNEGFLRYGQAITGYPIRHATIMEEPRNNSDREWLSTYLPAYIAPGGEIIHEYEEDTNGPGD